MLSIAHRYHIATLWLTEDDTNLSIVGVLCKQTAWEVESLVGNAFDENHDIDVDVDIICCLSLVVHLH